MKEVTVDELKSMMDNKEDFQLIDVREAYEYENANLGATLIPLNTIINQPEQIIKTGKTIIHCRSGARSAAAIQQLEIKYGLTNLYNLKGGILAWSKQIDQSLKVS